MSWSSIINQSRVKELLINSLKRERLAHAYLFSGPEGVGKYAMAIELAKIVNCEKRGTESCGACPNCLKFNTLQNPNVKLIHSLPVGKNEKAGEDPLEKISDDEIHLIQEQLNLKAQNPYHPIVIPRANNIKVNSIREIRRASSLSAFGSGKKVFIVIDAESMNDEASNALLKTLEEPHANTLLILTTSRPDSLLTTITSRCQLIRFDPLSDRTIAEALIEQKGIDTDRAKAIARLSNGSYSRALQYMDTFHFDRQKFAIEFLRTLLFKSRKILLSEIDKIIAEYQKPEIRDLLCLMQQWLHDAMLFQQGVNSECTDQIDESHKKFISYYPNWNYASACESIERAVSLFDKNVYIPLILLNLSIELKEHIGASSIVNS